MNISFVESNNNSSINISHSSILIMGKGDSEYKNLKITFPKNVAEAEDMYGESSELTKAYIEAKTIGATDIYLCNCFKFTDYIKAIELVSQNDFAYVCPLFGISTTYINPNTNKEVYFAEVYTEALADSFSNLLLTEKHASLYEDIDHYLTSMKSINYKFKNTALERMTNGQAMAFVLNNLKDYKFANVALAAIISKSVLRYYPQENLGQVVFDITKTDAIDHEFVYFAYDILAGTTIENLLNYHNKNTPEKMLLISIIKNRINMKLDYEQFTGSLINAYTKLKIDTYTREVLNSFTGVLIDKYELLDVEYIKVKQGEININIYLSIKPYASIEFIDMKVEV